MPSFSISFRWIAPTLAGLWLASAGADPFQIRDLRAPQWKSTIVRNVGTGVVQYTGDDTKYGNLAELVHRKLLAAGAVKPEEAVLVKTIDIRLSLPNARVDEAALSTTQSVVAGGQVLAGPVATVLSAFSKDKTASAVLCVSYEGKDFFSNDARLFRFGAESELADSIEAALQRLVAAIKSSNSATSPACEPGWEGGQPQ